MDAINAIPRKNILLLLKSIKILLKKFQIKLFIIGEYPNADKGVSDDFVNLEYLREVQLYIKQNNLNNKVEILFDIPHKDMQLYYNKADLFILPATNEPASISIVEALSSGLPSICSDNCGTKFYIQQNYNGYIFKDNSLLSLTRAIKKSLNNNNLQLLQKNAINYANINLKPNVFINKFNSILKRFNNDIQKK